MAELGRFAPSPSGRMHLGNVLCAVLTWLCARRSGGRLLLRIEDLDPQRCRREYADQLWEDLKWLGLTVDEGAYQGGSHGPYFQSRRSAYYDEALSRLREKGLLYPCFCTRAELHAASAPHRSDGTPVYSGACARLSPREQAARAACRAPALRLRVPDRVLSFQDGHFGLYEEDLRRECGDFVLRRSDGVAAYQLAVVVDDAAMGVTQVVRGRDLLSSTPRQLLLYELLELTPPSFFHVPLLCARDGRRLSKRDGDLDLGALRARYTPQQLLGRLAVLLGFHDRPEPLSLQDLLSVFSPQRIPLEDLTLPEGLF